jgi:hypothetical protein
MKAELNEFAGGWGLWNLLLMQSEYFSFFRCEPPEDMM